MNKRIVDIKIGRRHRKDMGDLEELAASIMQVGLLHPIVITPDNRLVAGERRLKAVKQLGRDSIPVTVVNLEQIAQGEYAENFFRKQFTPSEVVAIVKAIKPREKAAAKNRQGNRTDKHPEKFSEGSGRSLDHIAKIIGKSRPTIEKAQAVVDAAEAEPEKFGELKLQMDTTGKIDAAYKKLKTLKRRAEFDAAVQQHQAKPSDQEIQTGDCVTLMQKMPAQSIDVVVTSPPYNIGIDYRSHKDTMDRDAYLVWLGGVFTQVRRVLKPKGSFFLNIGNTSKDPWLETDVATVAFNSQFQLQNHIVWVKALAIQGRMLGHYKPINSQRFLNQTHEAVFHLTLNGDVDLDRLAIGVPFEDKSNIERRGHALDLHCAGDVWFIPYETVQSKDEKFQHPAGFPVALVERCIKLHGIRASMSVLDPFLGAGTTLEAAKRLGCRGIGIEIDPHYAKVAALRLDDAG